MAMHPYAPAHFMRPEAGGNRLTVGADIRLKGEIESCDTLLVEGRVEATLECRLLQIAERGAFQGTATVDIAEISGRFDGTLTVRDRLVLRTTGRVGGAVHYRRLEIQDGGEITGEVTVLAEKAEPAATLRKLEAPANDRQEENASPPIAPRRETKAAP